MRKYLAEFIGTFALVLVGAGAGAMGTGGLVGVALAHGLTVAAMVYAFGHISGTHINPAVSVAMYVSGKLSFKETLFYVLAQLAGAALAGWFLWKIFFVGYLPTTLGATMLGDRAIGRPGIGFACEAIGTFLFLTVIFGAAVDGRTAGNLAGLAIGLALTALILFFGPLTGASFNPARSFGPALALGWKGSASHWNHFWIYLAGPLLGGVVAGLVQTSIFMKRSEDRPQS